MSNASNTLDSTYGYASRIRSSVPARGQVLTKTDPKAGKAVVEVILDCPPTRVMDLLTDFRNLPTHVFCLHEASVVRQVESTASVQYMMKLPFPIGRVVWTNVVSWGVRDDGACFIDWALVDGDLSQCSGHILLRPTGEMGEQTHAMYQIHVEHKNSLPKRAQQLAVQWLLPRVIRRLCRRLESYE